MKDVILADRVAFPTGRELASGGEGAVLAEPLRQRMEWFFGADLSAVRIHVGPEPARLGTHAFAHGRHVYFAPGMFQPDTTDGCKMLAHELVHVLQQSCGRAHSDMPGVTVLDDRLLETEADLLAEQAAICVPGAGPRMLVDEAGCFRLSTEAGPTFADMCRARGWVNVDDPASGVIQRVVTYPAWWHAGTAAQVEAFIAAKAVAFPAKTILYNGTPSVNFFKRVTSFRGTEQAWVNNFFQLNLAQNAVCGAGIYATPKKGEALSYGANLMRTVTSTLQSSRYLDITGSNALQGSGLSQQDVRKHGYKCILKYTKDYYAVKDPRVEWEPDYI